MARRILVVDDDPVMSELVLLKLKQAGFEVSTAEDGEKGVQQAKAFKPDLMVLDLAMPKMHGYEVCKAIRADPTLSAIKIIVTSGKSYPVDIKGAKQAGANQYLVKPYPMQTLLTTIEELLGSSHKTKKILVVDDDEKIRMFVQDLLTQMGYAVLLAADGHQALEILRKEKPQLMVLDLAMPKMHGYEVCKAVRADSSPQISGIKIVVISAKNYPVDMKTAKEVGADLYLVKPFGLQELRNAVSQLLETAS